MMNSIFTRINIKLFLFSLYAVKHLVSFTLLIFPLVSLIFALVSLIATMDSLAYILEAIQSLTDNVLDNKQPVDEYPRLYDHKSTTLTLHADRAP